MTSNEDFVYAPLLGRAAFGKEVVQKSIKRVNVINPFLVATPTTLGDLVHPIFTAEFGSETHAQLTKNRKQINTIVLIYLFAIPAFMFWLDFKQFASMFLIALLSIYACGRYELSFIYNHPERLKAKVQFYTQALHSPKTVVFNFTAVFSSFGAVQWLIVNHMQDREGVLMKYGLILNDAFVDQFYRFATAPFIHVSVLHWALNLVVFIWFALLCYPVAHKYTTLCAVAIAVFANLMLAAAGQVIALPYDGVVGFSGGIAGLAGLLCGASAANHPALPKGLYISMQPVIFVTFFVLAFIQRRAHCCTSLEQLLVELQEFCFRLTPNENYLVSYRGFL
jgi:membrane associated rhomboid family serine protease